MQIPNSNPHALQLSAHLHSSRISVHFHQFRLKKISYLFIWLNRYLTQHWKQTFKPELTSFSSFIFM